MPLLKKYLPIALPILAVVIVLGFWLVSPSGQEAARQQLQAKLAQADEELKSSWAKWNQSEKQLQEQQAKNANFQRQIEELKRDHAVEGAGRISDLEKQLTAARSELAGAVKNVSRIQDELKTATIALAAARQVIKSQELTLKQAPASAPAKTAPAVSPTPPAPGVDVAALQEKAVSLEAKVRNFEDRLASAMTEIGRLRRVSEESALKAQQAQDELATVKQAESGFAETSAAYLAAAAPGEEGLTARQRASRQTRLLPRISELRKRDIPQDASATLDRLEVVLTRLDMIDVRDIRSSQSFWRLLDGGQLLADMDKTVSSKGSSSELRRVLIEAKLILSGVGNVK